MLNASLVTRFAAITISLVGLACGRKVLLQSAPSLQSSRTSLVRTLSANASRLMLLTHSVQPGSPFDSSARGELHLSSTGSFLRSQQNSYLTSLVNGINPQFEYHSGNRNFDINTTDAITGGIAVPNNSMVFQANGIAAYINNASEKTNAVGVYSLARASADSIRVWGSNPVATDNGFANITATGIEVDVNASQRSTVAQGITVQGGWSAQPDVANGVRVVVPSGGYHWLNGLGTDDAAAVNGLVLGAQAAVNGNCQPILMTARDDRGRSATSMIGCTNRGQLNLVSAPGQIVSIEGSGLATKALSIGAGKALTTSDCSGCVSGQLVGSNAPRIEGASLSDPVIGGGTPVRKYERFSTTITPSVVGAGECMEQSFSPPGISSLTTSDVVYVNMGSKNNLAFPTNYRVSAPGTLAVTFCNFTAKPIAPAITAISIVAWR